MSVIYRLNLFFRNDRLFDRILSAGLVLSYMLMLNY